MNSKDKAVIVAIFGIIILLFGIIYLGNRFMDIDKKGVACLNNPLTYAEFRMNEIYGKTYSCVCQDSSTTLILGNFTQIV